MENARNTRLASYGGAIRNIGAERVVEMRDSNDASRTRYQYRRAGDTIERRVLQSSGAPMLDGSPWEPLTRDEIASLMRTRGAYHPILDELGL